MQDRVSAMNTIVKSICAIICLAMTNTSLASAEPATEGKAATPAKIRVAVDIGHTRVQHGSTSARGKPEFDFNLRFVREFMAESKRHRGLELFVINPTGRRIGLKARVETAQKQGAELFLSVHHDALNNKYLKTWTHEGKQKPYSDAFRGFSIFVSSENPKYDQSLAAAKLIGTALKDAGLIQTLHHAEPIEGENRKVLRWDLGIYDVPFAVLRHAKMPAVLLEVGVILNRAEEELLEKFEYRKKIIGQLVKALEAFRKNIARPPT